MADSKQALVERLFMQPGDALQAFFRRHVRPGPDAAELAQELYLRMLRVPDFDQVRNLEAYLFTVASNLVTQHAVRERRQLLAVDGARRTRDQRRLRGGWSR